VNVEGWIYRSGESFESDETAARLLSEGSPQREVRLRPFLVAEGKA
jgi:hypothetical protein